MKHRQTPSERAPVAVEEVWPSEKSKQSMISELQVGTVCGKSVQVLLAVGLIMVSAEVQLRENVQECTLP